MIGQIARHEVASQLRDGRLLFALSVLLIALAAAGATGWVEFTRAQQEKHLFTAEARSQWLTQGERHPHRAAHFGAYVTKPELGLAFFEPGLRPFAGQTLWLEAHHRPAFTNAPVEDDLVLNLGLGSASSAAILQVLGGLMALCMGALAIAGERESGVLRQVLAQGVSARTWLLGKALGLGVVLAVPLGCASVLMLAGAGWMAAPQQRADVVVRGLLLIGANVLFLGALLCAGIAISAAARSTRAALTAALALWIGGFVLAPRAAATLTEQLAPTPTLQAYREALVAAFNDGIDDRGGYARQLQELEAHTLRAYGVQRLADLPVGFSGIRMKHMDRWSTEVDDLEYAKLERIYARQYAVRMSLAVLAPYIAARGASQGMAGMDWAHYRHFLQAAEQYRRAFAAQMNDLIETRLAGDRWEMNGSDIDWAQVPPLAYRLPGARWAVAQQLAAFVVLMLWGVGGAAALVWSARRLRP